MPYGGRQIRDVAQEPFQSDYESHILTECLTLRNLRASVNLRRQTARSLVISRTRKLRRAHWKAHDRLCYDRNSTFFSSGSNS